MEQRPINLTRRLLADFLKNPETIRAFENLNLNTEDLVRAVTEMQDASIIAIDDLGPFANGRLLVGDDDISVTDDGAGGDARLGLLTTGVTADVYGSGSLLVRVTVDEKGRITAAETLELNSDNVTEGSINLFFTVERARGSIDAGNGLAYDPLTGVMELDDPVSVANGGTGADNEPDARVNLGLEIGTDVQAHSGVLDAYAGGDTPSAFTLGIVDSTDDAAWRTAIGVALDIRTLTPVAAGTSNISASTAMQLVIDCNHTATIASHTFNLPALEDGQIVSFNSRAAITSATINASGGQTGAAYPASFTAGGHASFRWNAAANYLFRVE